MMKKLDNTRSHSWWWDSHISPKNSKWLQENLSEMDSKVSAMLRIIEEDADSFAQRAEMYYKKRPELINLVEEFYRTYRALVERYTYLTREIRQNVAPALQAQLGMSSESAQNSPVDLHSKKGIDGPEIISPSYSYTGASEFDCDSPTEASTKGQTDDDFSPLGFQTNYERRPFGFKARSLNMEGTSHKASDTGVLHGTGDAETSQLQMELVRLQEENKDLVLKSSEDVTKLKDLQLDLSMLQSQVRDLEAEDKLTKKRLKSVQQKEQKLEAENLKLSHALISSKEDKSDFLKEKKLMTEESRMAVQRIQVLEDEMLGLKAELLAARSRQSECEENFKENEVVIEKLQLIITTLEEQKLKDLFVLEVLEQKSHELLTRLSEIEQENTISIDKLSLQEAELRTLHKRLRDATENVRLSEQALHAASQEKACMEQGKIWAVSQMGNLQDELERTRRERERLVGDISRLENTIFKLEKEGQTLISEKMEITNHVCELETGIEDNEVLIKTLHASCQQYEDKFNALQVKFKECNEKLSFDSQEVSRLQHQAQTLQDTVKTAQLESEDLQQKLSSLAAEKLSMMGELENKTEGAMIAEGKCKEMHNLMQDKRDEIDMLREELMKHIDMVNILEKELTAASKAKFALVEEQAENMMAHQQSKHELNRLKQQLDENATLTKDKLAQLELQKTNLVRENQHMQQNMLQLQAMNTTLLRECLESRNGLQASEEAAREAQRELGLLLEELEKKLQADNHAKGELLSDFVKEVETLETRAARLREENDTLRDSVDKYSTSLAALETNNNVLTVRLSDLGAQNSILAAHLSGKEKIVHDITDDLSNAQMRVAALGQESESKAAETLNLQQQNSSLEHQLGLVHVELVENISKNERLEAIIEKQRNEISEINEVKEVLIHEKQMTLNDVAVFKNMNQDLETNISQLTRERALLQEGTKTHLAHCDYLTEKIASLETAYEAAQKEILKLKGQLMESEEESFKKLLEYEGRLQDLRLKLSDMLAAEVSLAEQLVERIGSIHKLENALLDLQKDNLALNEDLSCLQKQVSSFRIRETSLLTEMHNGSNLINSLSAELERFKQVTVEAEESEKRLSLEQKRTLEDCHLLQQKLDKLQREFEISVEERTLHLKDIAYHSGRSSELECNVKRLETEQDCLRQELSRAQHVEYRLNEQLEKLEQDIQKLANTLDSQQKKMGKQEEEFCSLECELSSARNEQQMVVEKLELLSEEKKILEHKLMEREHDLEEVRENFTSLETDFTELQQVTEGINIDIRSRVEEARVLRENTIVLQTVKSELEHKLHLCSRQALEKEDREKELVEMLSIAQQKITELELNIAKAQKGMIETIEEGERHREDIIVLTQELAAVSTTKKELEQEAAKRQEEKVTYKYEVEKLQQQLKCIQEEKEKSDSALETAMLQRHKDMAMLLSLQEQLQTAADSKMELDMRYLKLTAEGHTAERDPQEEMAQQKLDPICDEGWIENQLKNSQGHLAEELEARLSEQQWSSNLSTQSDAQEMMIKAAEECERHSKDVDSLKKELATVNTVNKELEQELAKLREDKIAHSCKLEKLQQELKRVQDQTDESDLALGSAILQRSKDMAMLLSLQEQVRSAAGLKLELDGRYSKLMTEWGGIERKCEVETSEQKLTSLEGKSELIFAHKCALELEDESRPLEATKEDVIFDKASIKNQSKDLQEFPAEAECPLSEKQDYSLNFSGQPKRLQDDILLKENINLKLCKPVHIWEKNNEFIQKTRSRDENCIKFETLEGSLKEFEEFNESQKESKLKEVAYQVQAKENVLFDVQNTWLTIALSTAKEENALLQSKLAEEVAVLKAAKHELSVVRKEKDELSNGQIANLSEQVQQEQLSLLQGEIDHLNLEVELYKEEIHQLKKLLLGKELQEKAEITHNSVEVVQRMLYDLRKNLVILEATVRGLRDEMEMKIGQNRSLQCLSTDVQVESLPCTSLLKNKVLLLCKAIKLAANDWNEKAYNNKNSQIIAGIEKLSRAEALSIRVDAPADYDSMCIDNGTNEASKPTLECICMLHQLQRRTEEVSILYEAVRAMLPANTSKGSKDATLGTEDDDPSLQQQQFSMKNIERVGIDMEVGDSIMNSIPVGLMHGGMETMINESKDAEENAELFESLAQFHINLEMRLHQALMDEKLENELQELKNEREKLKDDLQARVQQVRRTEAELEKLQGFLRGEEGEELDIRQQQQVLLYKKRAEKKASRLSKELVLQRDHVRNLQDALVAWTEQQELATEILEEKVFYLVSKECSPNMEGWDVDEVAHLMQEMQSRKALTRRHSMDLQSVGQQLHKVGSSIESTQRKLLEGVQEQEEANDERVSSETSPETNASELTRNQQKISKFGLAWLLLLLTTRSRSSLKASLKDRSAVATPASEFSRQHTRPGSILSSVVAQTRKMSCCACVSRSDQLKAVDNGKE